MPMLKADFHLHTKADPCDRVEHSCEDIIDLAAAKGYQVLAITNHGVLTFSDGLQAYAADRGILLLPGVEMKLEGKHVILINCRPEHLQIRDFKDLRVAREESLLVIAPHPFYPVRSCLNGKFMPHRDLFDAVEFSHYYHPLVNFNRKAVRVCRKHGIPLIGSSDTHMLCQFNTTWTLVDAPQDPLSVVRAVRAGRVRIETQPLSLFEMVRIAVRLTWFN